jgi:CheY-like chemotaxis protein
MGGGLMAAILHGLRMLIVEDEAIVAMLVEDMLAEMGCEVVDVVASVNRGLEVLERTPQAIDAAILDVNLGGEKVFPIADRLARLGKPFIFATGYGRAGLEGRFEDRMVLAKPFRRQDVETLLAAAIAA